MPIVIEIFNGKAIVGSQPTVNHIRDRSTCQIRAVFVRARRPLRIKLDLCQIALQEYVIIVATHVYLGRLVTMEGHQCRAHQNIHGKQGHPGDVHS